MKYQSAQLGAIYESAKDLYEIGAISVDEMQEFAKGCLVLKPAKRRRVDTSISSSTSPIQRPTVQPVMAAQNRA
jgi:DNA-binding transcriptional regulator YiaG